MSTIREQLEPILTVPAFKAWLETQDPAETFHYFRNQECVVAQFLKAQPAFQALIATEPNWGVGGDDVRVGIRLAPNGETNSDNVAALPYAIADAAHAHPTTYGNVLADLDALIIERGNAAEVSGR